MGNDGGSIPTRRELVKNAARLPTVSELKATAHEALVHSWQTDPVSGEPLDLDNVVSDWRGRLYNYETVLQGLTSSKSDEDDAKKDDEALELLDEVTNGRDVSFAETGIRSIRDIVRLQGTPYKSPSTSTTASTTSSQKWQCPVTLKALGPLGKSVYVVPCGHVFSEAAIITIATDKLCPECSVSIEPSNIITILPSEKADVMKLRKRIEALKADGLTHGLKKEKKEKSDKKDRKDKDKKNKNKRKASDGDDGTTGKEPTKKKEKASNGDSDKTGLSSRINNSMTASVTARVMAEQEALRKQRKLESKGR